MADDKPKKREKIEVMSFGLKTDELNEKFGGGIPPNSLVLVEAANTMGKSITVQRMAYGFLHNDFTLSYISTELSIGGFLKQMTSLSYHVKDKLFSNDLLFVSMFPYMGNVSLKSNFIYDILATKKLFEKDIIIIDSLSYLIVENELNYKNCFKIMKYLKQVCQKGKIIAITIDPTCVGKNMMEMLRSLSDVYVKIEEKEQFGIVVKKMHIDRFIGAANDVETELAFKVKARVGIVVEVSSLA